LYTATAASSWLVMTIAKELEIFWRGHIIHRKPESRGNYFRTLLRRNGTHDASIRRRSSRFVFSSSRSTLLSSLKPTGPVRILTLTIDLYLVSESSTPTNSNSQPTTTISTFTQLRLLAICLLDPCRPRLALNAITQNSTLSRHFPSGALYALFPTPSSPIVCAADSLEVLPRLLAYMYTGASHPNATACCPRADVAASPRKSWRGGSSGPPATLGNQHLCAHIVLLSWRASAGYEAVWHVRDSIDTGLWRVVHVFVPGARGCRHVGASSHISGMVGLG
jgi:hypothetical protein